MKNTAKERQSLGDRNKWGRKRYFVSVRFLQLGIGVVNQLFLVRLLSLHDFAVIAFAEAIYESVTSILRLGRAEGLARELSTSNEGDQVDATGSSLISTVATAQLKLGLIGVASVAIAGGVLTYFEATHEYGRYVFLYSPVILAGLIVQIAQATMRGTGQYGNLAIALVTPQAGKLLVCVPAAANGLLAYVLADVGTRVMGAIILWATTFKPHFKLRSQIPGGKANTSRLNAVSWASYTANVCAEVSRRAMFAVSPFLFGPTATGAARVAQSFANRITFLNQAYSTLLMPNLTKIYVKTPQRFGRRLLRELTEVFLLNSATAAAFSIAWFTIGSMLVGKLKYDAIGEWYHLFVVAAFAQGMATIVRRLSLVAAADTAGLSWQILAIHSSALGLLVAFWLLGAHGLLAIGLSFSCLAVTLLSLYALRTLVILQKAARRQHGVETTSTP